MENCGVEVERHCRCGSKRHTLGCEIFWCPQCGSLDTVPSDREIDLASHAEYISGGQLQ